MAFIAAELSQEDLYGLLAYIATATTTLSRTPHPMHVQLGEQTAGLQKTFCQHRDRTNYQHIQTYAMNGALVYRAKRDYNIT